MDCVASVVGGGGGEKVRGGGGESSRGGGDKVCAGRDACNAQDRTLLGISCVQHSEGARDKLCLSAPGCFSSFEAMQAKQLLQVICEGQLIEVDCAAGSPC